MTTQTRDDTAETVDEGQEQIPFWRAVLLSNDMPDTERVRHLADTCRWYGDILNYVQVALDRGDVEAATACLRNPYQFLGEESVPLTTTFFRTIEGRV